MASGNVGSLRSAENDVLIQVVKEARLQAGISQEDLSKRLGQSVTFIVKFERGTRRLDVIEFVRVCQVLEVPPSRLLQTVVDRMSGASL